MNEHIAIAIHGGAGTLDRKRFTSELRKEYENALKGALDTGLNVLKRGGCSIDAVEAAVIVLEDCPFFNAGRGSVFNQRGRHEMDAAIMDGSNLAAGAVACVQLVKNPVRLARAIMEKSNFVLLTGEGAGDFAKAHQLPMETEAYFYTDLRYNEWQKKLQADHKKTDKQFGTVGAVALDKDGNLAAATSTGGTTNKAYGRVGDSPLIGAGTYANNNTCAVSCTGDGEQFIRAVAAYDVSCCMEYKQVSLHQACACAMEKLQKVQGSGGLIAVDRLGHIAMPYNSEGMYRACYHPDGVVEVKIFE